MMDPKQCTSWPSLGHKKFAIATEDTVLNEVQVQVQSLFQDQTVFWIRTVNRIDKFVREAYADPRGRESFVETRCKSETNIKTVINKWLGFSSLNRDNGLTLKHRNPMILVVNKCQNSSLDYFDTVEKFIEKLVQQSIMTKLLMNARNGNPTIQDVGQTR